MGMVAEHPAAELAAHLHDSVLQTLALIQRAASSQEMVGLARSQERDLRAWLNGRTTAAGPMVNVTNRGALTIDPGGRSPVARCTPALLGDPRVTATLDPVTAERAS